MKIILTVILITLSLSSYSQKFSISLYQDAKLLLMTDGYKNDPPTLDMVAKFKFSGKFLHATLGIEQANLYSGSLTRFSFGGGVHYRYKFIEVSQEINYGYLLRPFSDSWSYGADTEISFFVSKKISLIGMIQVVNRTDWNRDFIRWSGFIGVGYNF